MYRRTIQLEVDAVDTFRRNGELVMRLVTSDGRFYEVPMRAAHGLTIGAALTDVAHNLMRMQQQRRNALV